MFGSNDRKESPTTTAHSEDTVIGKTIKIEGDLVSQGNIVVEGEVVGTLKTDKMLRVGEGAKVNADVKANSAHIAGTVNGNMVIAENLELTETARVTGDVTVKVLSISPGANLNGRCSMDGGVKIVSQPKPESKDNGNHKKSEV